MITQKDHNRIQIARKLIHKSAHPKYNIAAILMQSNRVIKGGVNKTSPAKFFVPQARYNQGLHAEISALIGISKVIAKNGTLYVAGLSAAGNKITTKPCDSCKCFLAEMGIRRIVYETPKGLEELK